VNPFKEGRAAGGQLDIESGPVFAGFLLFPMTDQRFELREGFRAPGRC